jgi:8-oxo-dGTP pyrophosphatase MutT (NUDIX family)
VTLAADAAQSAVPVRPAATIMLLEDRPDLHVLLLRRRAGSAFVGGLSVFTGGGVDAADAEPAVEACCTGLDDRAASRRLGVARGGLAYWVAAVRETFEEAGVLLAVDAASGRPVDLASPDVEQRFATLRADVDAGRVRLADAVRAEGLRLSVDAIHYAARWITPEGPPRRYDTRFFVAALPTGQIAVHDDREAVDSEWRRPADALARFARGELALLPPTVGMLRILAGFSRAADAVAAAAAQQDGPDRAALLTGEGASWRVVLPGDSDYETAPAQDLRAWVRLFPPGGAAAPLPGRGE